MKFFYLACYCLFLIYNLIQAHETLSIPLQRFSVPTHHPPKWNRYRQLNDGTYEITRLWTGPGTHFATIFVGDTRQPQALIVDTGSHVLAFPCTGCKACGKHFYPIFDILNSTSISYLSCNAHRNFGCRSCTNDDKCILSQRYTEGSSWTATMVEDYVMIGNGTKPTKQQMKDLGVRFAFGCQLSETGLFVSQEANGIMGMSGKGNTLAPVLYKKKKLKHEIFSLCFTQNGGSMALGAPEIWKHTEPIQYAKITINPSNYWFAVHLRDIRFNGVSIGADPSIYTQGKKFIVDSGTTDTYFPSVISSSFKEVFKRVAGVEYEVSSESCHGYTKHQLNNLPDLELVMEGIDGSDVVLKIPATQYASSHKSGNKWCSTIFLTEGTGGVLGANIMMGHDVVFDKRNSQVGFAKANCDLPKDDTTVVPTSSTTDKISPNKPTTESPSKAPTIETPTKPTTEAPSKAPTTETPTKPTTKAPSKAPTTETPTKPTTKAPSKAPTTETPTKPTTKAPSKAPTTETPTKPTTKAPSKAPTTETPTMPSTEAPSKAPTTETPTEPTTKAPSKAPTTETPTMPSTEAPTASMTTSPTSIKPSKASTDSHSVTNTTQSPVPGNTTSINGTHEQPFVVALAGVALAATFVCGVAIMCFKRKRKSRKWIKLQDEEEDIEDGEEFGLVNVTTADVDDERPEEYRDHLNRRDETFEEDDDFFDAGDEFLDTHDKNDLDRL